MSCIRRFRCSNLSELFSDYRMTSLNPPTYDRGAPITRYHLKRRMTSTVLWGTAQLFESFFVRKFFCPKAEVSENKRVSCSKRLIHSYNKQLTSTQLRYIFSYEYMTCSCTYKSFTSRSKLHITFVSTFYFGIHLSIWHSAF